MPIWFWYRPPSQKRASMRDAPTVSSSNMGWIKPHGAWHTVDADGGEHGRKQQAIDPDGFHHRDQG